MPPSSGSPVLTRGRDILVGYDVMLCDIWGVIHNGVRAFDSANEALVNFRVRGGSVVLISNAPMQERFVAALLDERGVKREAWDRIVTSGDLAIRHVGEQGYRAIHPLIYSHDEHLFRDIAARHVPLADAEAIVCSGLVDDINETAETYRPLLDIARRREMPFVCANPDLVVDIAGRHFLCAGAIAALYEEMGGNVFWAGKPHPSAYIAAKARAEQIRDASVASHRILAIGDALRTDLAGAAQADIDALFIGSGIHRHDSMTGAALDPAKLARLFAPGSPPAIGAMPMLAW